MTKMGHLTVLMGCMFAQKTTELLRRIRRFKAIGYKVLVVN
jgi:thymidine kinase